MITNENLIKPGCEYFFNTPTQLAKTLFFYPTIVGDFKYLSGYQKNRSSFDSFLLMFIESGNMRIRTDDKMSIATAGQVVFLDCYAPHEYTALTGAHVLWIHFDGALARGYYNELTSRFGNVIMPSNPSRVKEFFHDIYKGFAASNPQDETMLSLNIVSILTCLFHITDQSTSTGQSGIRKSISYISDNFTRQLSLEEIANEAALSPYYFIRAFKKETGVSPHQYLIETRISYAKYYLSSTQKPISEIAYSSGFNDDSAFCSTFKKRTGMTPKEYRNLRLENN